MRGTGAGPVAGPAAGHPEEQPGLAAVLQRLQHPDHHPVLLGGHHPLPRYEAARAGRRRRSGGRAATATAPAASGSAWRRGLCWSGRAEPAAPGSEPIPPSPPGALRPSAPRAPARWQPRGQRRCVCGGADPICSPPLQAPQTARAPARPLCCPGGRRAVRGVLWLRNPL